MFSQEHLLRTLENLPNFNIIGISLEDKDEEYKKKSKDALKVYDTGKVPVKSKKYIVKQFNRLDFGEDD